MTKDEACKVVGAHPDEVVSVEDAPGGTLITTTDGTTVIYVPADKPDAEGKTGLMHVTRPLLPNGEVNQTTFPVYANPEGPVRVTEPNLTVPEAEEPVAPTVEAKPAKVRKPRKAAK